MSFSSPVAIGVRPKVGSVIPGWLLRAVFAAIGLLLCLDRFGLSFPLFLGITLIGYAVVRPNAFAAWGLILLLCASQLAQAPSLEPRFLLLLVGLHALQALAALASATSPRTRVQVRYLGRILLRFAAIELLVQGIAVLSLWSLVPRVGEPMVTVPVIAEVGAAGLIGIVLIFASSWADRKVSL